MSDILETTEPHTEWEELGALAAIDGLTAEEAVRFGKHLAGCVACRVRLAEYQMTVARLASSVPMLTAPAHLAQDLRATVRRARPRRRAWSPVLAWGIAAAALCAALVFGAQNIELRRDLAATQPIAAVSAPNAKPIALAPSNAQPAAGKFVWAPNQRVASLAIAGLPTPTGGRAYQLWFQQKNGTIISGGTFTIGADGLVRMPITAAAPWTTFSRIFVTEEPANGSSQPTTTNLLSGIFAT